MTTEIIDIEKLVAPLQGDSTAGIDLRDNPDMNNIYYLMKDARNAARLKERTDGANQGSDELQTVWGLVCRYGITILETESKDIEVLAWLIEGLLRLHGFAGLTLGFQLALNLFEKYGINLYPQPEENEGLEWQVRALSGLNGEEIDGSLIEPIMNVPVTNQPVYAMWHYLQANEIAKIADSARRSRRLERGGIALEDYMQALNATSLEQLNKLQLQLKQAQEAHIQLTEKLSNIYKDSAPPSSHIAYALASYQQNLTQLIDLRQQSMDLEHEHHDVEDASVDSVTAIQKNHYTRQSAIRELLVIADFIRANEPHSPLPYMLARVVEWAQLPLPQLLPKMIKNTAELDQVFALTGIKPESVTT